MYKYNKKSHKRDIATVLYCTVAVTVGFIIGVWAFYWGMSFNAKALTESASVLHVDTSATTNAKQAYDNSSYYLQPTVSPYNTNTTQLVNEYTPTIQQLIMQANTHKLPDWVK